MLLLVIGSLQHFCFVSLGCLCCWLCLWVGWYACVCSIMLVVVGSFVVLHCFWLVRAGFNSVG